MLDLAHRILSTEVAAGSYWMFAEHNGDPAQFLAACKQHAPGVQPRLMSQGELYMYSAGTSRSR